MSYRTLGDRDEYNDDKKTMRQRIHDITLSMSYKKHWNLLTGLLASLVPIAIVDGVGRIVSCFIPPIWGNELVTNPVGLFAFAFGVGAMLESLAVAFLIIIFIFSFTAELGESILDKIVARLKDK